MFRRIHLCILGLIALAAPIAASTISYQGQLNSNGQPFDGNAQFKFVILCDGASAWSNDDSSTGGGEPTAAVTLSVQQGLFDVQLGDTALGMSPIGAAALHGCSARALRVWVDSGSGFEQLSDQPLGAVPHALLADSADASLGQFTMHDGFVVLNDSQQPVITGFDNGGLKVNALIFSDNTAMVTAPGATGPDNDWTISGGNMYSNVHGNVGIGTQTPDRPLTVNGGSSLQSIGSGGQLRLGVPNSFTMLFDTNTLQAAKDVSAYEMRLNPFGGDVGIGVVSPLSRLHVGGDTRIDGSNGVGVDSRNPNALNAYLRMGFSNNVARLRVGGSGSGSTSGLNIQGSSDQSLLRLLDNGNVGVGTTAPTERLDVDGNLRVRGDLIVEGDFDVAGVGIASGIYTISGAAMNPQESTMAFHRSSVTLHGTVAGGGMTFEAPVVLPHGVKILSFTAVFSDSDGTRNIQTFLTSKPLSGATGAIIATQATSGTPGYTSQTSSNLSTIVDNNANSYNVSASWTTPTTVTNIRLHAFKIVYGPATP